MQSVVQTLEETGTEIHIANWVNSLREVNASWNLSISVGPVVLDTLHVPLVDNHDHTLLRALVNGLKQVVVAEIDKDALEVREIDSHILNKPVDQIGVQTLLGELRGFALLHALVNFLLLEGPAVKLHVNEFIVKVIGHV